MNQKRTIVNVLPILFVLCLILEGCAPLQNIIRQSSADKEHCILNKENVTQFTFQSKSYTILDDTVSNNMLGEWIGYIRKLAAVDDKGHILYQENMEETSLQSLTQLTDHAPEASYLIPFLNVYTAPNDASCLIVDANGGYHKAVPTDTVTTSTSIFDFKTGDKTADYTATESFTLNPDNATQLLYGETIYQVTSDIVSADSLGNYLGTLAENITFDADTKKPLSKAELSKIDWTGTDSHPRETWFYTDIYSLPGTEVSEAVAVNVNNTYYLAKAQ